MTSINPGLSFGSMPQATREQYTEGTLHSWEASSFNGLFEMHLTRDAQSGLRQDSRSGPGGLPDRGDSPSDAPRSASARQGSGAEHAAAVRMAADETGLQVPADEAGASFTAAAGMVYDTSLPENAQAVDGETPASAGAAFPAPAVEPADAQARLQRATLAANADGAEIYVRAPALDAESGLAFARAASQLLLEHRLSLGRVKINGHVAGPADEGRPESPAASS